MGESPRKLLNGVALDDVADLEVVEVQNTDSTLEALTDFLDVILETADRLDSALPDDDGVAEQTNLVVSADLAVLNERAADRADL